MITRLQAVMLHGSNLLVGGTGILWWFLHHGFENDDPYSVVSHPLEPTMHELHVLFAPWLLFALGWVLDSHVLPKLRSGISARRRSGILLLAQVVPMAASGYLLQISETPAWQAMWRWTHWVTSALWVLAYVAHLFSRRVHAEAEADAHGSPDGARLS